MTAAARVARHRQRQREGKVLLTIEADEAALSCALVGAQLLDPLQADDRAALQAALERAVNAWCDVTRDYPT